VGALNNAFTGSEDLGGRSAEIKDSELDQVQKKGKMKEDTNRGGECFEGDLREEKGLKVERGKS